MRPTKREYFPEKSPFDSLLRGVPTEYLEELRAALGPSPSPLSIRLAGAWTIQVIQRPVPMPRADVLKGILERRWESNDWWKKERRDVALIQIASKSFGKRVYSGWSTALGLAGFNIQAFLFLLGEIWDEATKRGIDPLDKTNAVPLKYTVQTVGVYTASDIWLNRDKDSRGGARRYSVVTRLGAAINKEVLDDWSLSNPGHSGFSLREADLLADSPEATLVRDFLNSGVGLGVFEERAHSSKERGGAQRRKWFLHPLLAPSLTLPHKRVKEPKYVSVTDVYRWITETGQIRFGHARDDSAQRRLYQGRWGSPK